MNETGVTLFWAQIRNLVLFVDGISALGLPFLVDFLAPPFLAIDLEGFLILASTLDIANGRTRLECSLLLAKFLPPFFRQGLKVLAGSSFLLPNFEGLFGVGAWSSGNCLKRRRNSAGYSGRQCSK